MPLNNFLTERQSQTGTPFFGTGGKQRFNDFGQDLFRDSPTLVLNTEPHMVLMLFKYDGNFAGTVGQGFQGV